MANLFNTGGAVIQSVVNNDEVPTPVVTDDISDEGGEYYMGR